MKNIFSFRTFVIGLILLLAGNMASAQSKTMTTALKGSIRNPQRDFILLSQQGRTDTVKLSKEGGFDILIEQNAANYFTIEHAKQTVTLFLLPSDEVEIKLNATNLAEIKEITGNSSNYCRYIWQRVQADREFASRYPAYVYSTMPGDLYFAKRDSARLARQEFLKAESFKQGFIQSFSDQEKKSIDYQMGYDLINYKNQAAKTGNMTVPASVENYLQSLSLNEESISYDQYFLGFAMNYINLVASNRYYSGSDKSVLHYYELHTSCICELVKSDKNKSILFAETVPQMMNDVGTSDIRKIIATMESCCSDKKLISSVKNYAAQFEYLYPGKPAPDAEFYDANGNKSRLSDYRGKVVYIDTWATWCGPCKREIPSLKALEEAYHGKNIQFISVSTDKDINAWKNFIAKESMGGLQLHQSDDFNQSISRLYIVNSIPRFILIDKEGKIVNVDAPRPSSGDQIRQILDSLLAE